MVTIPARVWRQGPYGRALIVGGVVGLSLGVLAWIDSGLAAAGIAVFVVVGGWYGSWMARRMARFWPAARTLTGAQRLAVAGAARRGVAVPDPALSGALADYACGLHAAADQARPWRRLLIFVLVVAVLTAVWDAVFGSLGNAVVSCIYLALLAAEIWWWPTRQDQLLANADAACSSTRIS
ncbi:hypothetical protein ACWDUN_05080 [Mycobacterium sp. NPDC003323]